MIGHAQMPAIIVNKKSSIKSAGLLLVLKTSLLNLWNESRGFVATTAEAMVRGSTPGLKE